MGENSKISETNKPKKRDLLTIIDYFYEYLATKDQVHISEFRNLDQPINSPTDQRILKIIERIQDRPYIYIKKRKREKKTQIILKLSKHNRDPKKRYIQLKPVIDNFKQKSDELRHNAKTWDKSQYGLILDQYNELIQETIVLLNRVFHEDEIKNFEE